MKKLFETLILVLVLFPIAIAEMGIKFLWAIAFSFIVRPFMNKSTYTYKRFSTYAYEYSVRDGDNYIITTFISDAFIDLL